MTFSLLARDAHTGQLGVTSQSHYFRVGPTVTWAEAGVGVVATQAFATPSYGARGLAIMRSGCSAQDALSELLADDPHREIRQVALLDASGGAGIHTGSRCVGAVGLAVADNAVALGNMLDNPNVPDAVLLGYQHAEGHLAHRLVAGLRHGDRAGGDIRGRQSAALLVVGGQRGETPWDGVLRDLRVDDHREPIDELARLIELDDAFAKVSSIVFDPHGPILGLPERHSDADVTTAAAMLQEAHDFLDDNPEAVFWSAVLHAKFGLRGEARRLLDTAASRNERLLRFLGRIADAKILTAPQVAALRPAIVD
ncbi:DUF1028 domain-containing protein [Mycobacterium vicinigordonae]|uniref:DUF1028 domain-containing protein n=1 Tax=Mycobacterium vicinigordonae TaxID=1719132 RepID=A0A7D6E7W8_9MYCO|nr:DUF1028 domain-containing protein [Mycobacterium vicinigordonae]QLL09242.1 DUF1028 domain-containing protein [Mycobacterium vicinigordonae]